MFESQYGFKSTSIILMGTVSVRLFWLAKIAVFMYINGITNRADWTLEVEIYGTLKGT